MSWFAGLKTWQKAAIPIVTYFVAVLALKSIVPLQPKNNAYKPQNEFKLDPWISFKVGGLDLSINKAVFYLFVACALTAWLMVYIARRMQQRPNNVQTAVEAAYDLAYNNMTRGNMDPGMAAKWFPFIGALFFFILISNFIGYLPVPTNTEYKTDILGVHVPSLALYAATANISVTLVLTLMVWFTYHVQGIRAKGLRGYFASFIPAGTPGAMRVPIFGIEVISHFVRIISLSVRLFANILAGHLLILFMAGGMIVLLGAIWIGPLTLLFAVAFFFFEVAIVAGLQAFIFATLTSIYLGGATAAGH
jgi:F-type H+-transporting ATPase subunit a